jgi:hypothetical protein
VTRNVEAVLRLGESLLTNGKEVACLQAGDEFAKARSAFLFHIGYIVESTVLSGLLSLIR